MGIYTSSVFLEYTFRFQKYAIVFAYLNLMGQGLFENVPFVIFCEILNLHVFSKIIKFVSVFLALL